MADLKDLVSVIITTYQRDVRTLAYAVRSVMRQTHKNIELIIVNDNGEKTVDGLSEYLEDMLTNSAVKVINHKHNSGAQQSRNDGVLAARGSYVAFLDDDDQWYPTKIEQQLKRIKENGAVLCYCRGETRVLDSDNNTVEIQPYMNPKLYKDEVTTADLLYLDRVGTTSQALIKRDALINAGMFDIDQPARQDYELWIRLSLVGRCVGVNSVLFIHNIHSGEQISKSKDKALEGYEKIHRKYASLFVDNPTAELRLYIKLAKLEPSVLGKLHTASKAARSALRAAIYDRSNLKAALALETQLRHS